MLSVRRPVWYHLDMTSAEMEKHDSSMLRLDAEQAAEVRRRLANPSRDTIPAEDVFKRFRS